MYCSVSLRTFSLSCDHHDHPSPELFHIPELKLCPVNNDSPIPASAQPPATTIPLCLCEFDYSRKFIKAESYSTCPFVTHLFLSGECLCGSCCSMLQIPSFLRLKNILLCIYSTFSLFITLETLSVDPTFGCCE